jgi:prolyl-tRNA synthetase
MNCVVLDENGKNIPMEMGCYGIGVTRVIAAAIEQNHDDKGILWPKSMAPFEIAIIPINYQKSEAVCKEADSLYEQLTAEGYEVILDDRKERPGVMFADMELIGVPYIIIIGEKALAEGMVEYENRATLEKTKLPLADALAQIKKMLSE